MKLSVLIPSYRRPVDLGRCLAAIARQRRRPDQVVVVVRDSDPESREVVEKATLDWPELPLEVTTVRRAGIVVALNAGLDAVIGDVYCFTDDDAEPPPCWLERIEAHYRDPDVVGVGGRDILVRQPETIDQTCSVVGRGSWYGRFVGNHHLSLVPAQPMAVEILKGVNMSFRASALPGFRFDEAIAVEANSGSEFDISFAARRNGGQLIYDPAITVNHHARPRPDQPSREDSIRFYDYSHNTTYLLLKYLPWWRRLTFLAYFFAIGQRASWGAGTLVWDLVRQGRFPPWIEIRYSLVGKLAGVRQYLRTRR